MDEALLAAYHATQYRVRLACGGYAAIRIGLPLPRPLQTVAGIRPWSVITAWNPQSHVTPLAQNRAAQRTLLASLLALSDTVCIGPGRNVGTAAAWTEPNLWVVGPGIDMLDALARRFGQFGYVHGKGDGVATLKLTGLA